MIFASKTKAQIILEKTKILENIGNVDQQIIFRISEFIAKYHLRSVRIWYQHLPIFNQISTPHIYLKQPLIFDAVFVSKVFQNVTQNVPKMLGRN